MQRGEHADPAIGQIGQQVLVQQHGAGIPRLDADEENDDGEEGGGGDDEVHRQRHEHAAVVEPGQDGEGEDREGLPGDVMAELGRPDLEQLAGDLDVAGFQHGIGEHEIEPDVEGHQRADGVLGLGILPAGRGHGRGDLGIDHGHAGIEQADDPAGDERAEGPTLAHAVVPAHELADQHDADAERPDMDGAEDLEEVDLLGRRWRDLLDHGSTPLRLAGFGKELVNALARAEENVLAEILVHDEEIPGHPQEEKPRCDPGGPA